MARHDQRPEKSRMVCIYCRYGTCDLCVDTVRLKIFSDPLCQCSRKEHESCLPVRSVGTQSQ